MNESEQMSNTTPIRRRRMPECVPTGFYCGTPVAELTREELLSVVGYFEREIQSLTRDRDRWCEAGDPAKYLLDGANR